MAVVSKFTYLSEAIAPAPPTNQKRTGPGTDRSEIAPFSRVGVYNHYTTLQPVICQFEKTPISLMLYCQSFTKSSKIGNVFNERFQKKRADSFSNCQPFEHAGPSTVVVLDVR